MRVDMHTHVTPPPGSMDWAARFGPGRWPSLTGEEDGRATLRLGEQVMMTIDDRFWSPERRLRDMDRSGIDAQVISPIPLLSGYALPAEGNAEVARFLNDGIAEIVAGGGGRFIGMGTVPLQSPELALAEMRRLRELGFRAVQIGTCPAGRDLDDPALFPFLKACEDQDVAVFVHPMQPLAGGERLNAWYLPNIVGNPLETALAMTRLVVSGVLDRLPRLRIGFAHGGGAFAQVLGRLDKGFTVRAEMRRDIDRPPSEHARRLFVDALTFDAESLRLAASKFGGDRLMLGSDYPFGLGDDDPAAAVEAAGLPPEVARAACDDNVWSFLGRT